jgi:ubiquinone/menaquinone biosynthesis C-methylase UbiE
LFSSEPKDGKEDIVKFKKEIWQTDDISKAFVNGSDSKSVMAADIMDREVNEFFFANCSKGDKVLDIGCGHGIVSEYLAERGIDMWAMDISEKLLDNFKARIAGKNLPIEITRGDAYNTPYKDGQFDVVVARMFLPHFPDWPLVLKEMTRITKPGGKMLVHFSSAENTALGKTIGDKYCDFASSPDTADPWRFYAETDDKELQKICAPLGLQVVQRTPVSFFLHNRVIGHQIGHENYHTYMEKVQEFLKDEKVKEFIVWFDTEILSKCAPALSHFNIITFKKN